MRYHIHFILSALALGMLSSCATIFNGGKPLVVIEGNIDEPVTITTPAATYTDVTLPVEVQLNHRHISGQHIQIESGNQEFEDIIVEKRTANSVYANIFNHGLMLPVDWMTNCCASPRHNHYLIAPKGEGKTIKSTEPFYSDRPVNRPHAKDFYRHEVSVSIGYGVDALEYSLTSFIEAHVEPYGFEGDFCCFNGGEGISNNQTVDYLYNINRRLGVGISFGRGSENGGTYSKCVTGDEDNPGDYHYYLCYPSSKTKFVMPSVRYKWWISKNNIYSAYFQAYLGWGRRSFWVEGNKEIPECTITENRLGYHITFAGIEFGRGHLRTFVEAGIGFRGYSQGGLKFCF